MATHSSIFAWRTSWTEEPGWLQSMGSQRVGHDWRDLARLHAHRDFQDYVSTKCGMLSKDSTFNSETSLKRRLQGATFLECFQNWERIIKRWLCVLCVQLCLTLWDSMDCSPPGSSVHEISQARILEEWVVISSSRGSSQPRDLTLVSCISDTGRQILYYGATCETRIDIWSDNLLIT